MTVRLQARYVVEAAPHAAVPGRGSSWRLLWLQAVRGAQGQEGQQGQQQQQTRSQEVSSGGWRRCPVSHAEAG